MTSPQTALHELREALRAPIPSVDEFTFLLSSTLDTLGLGTARKGIAVPVTGAGTGGAIKAIDRSLGSVQQALLASAIPTFLHALDKRGCELLDSFFCPSAGSSISDAAALPHIALCTYQTLSSSLSVRAGIAPLPIESRTYIIDIAGRLAGSYGLKELYGAIWPAESRDAESSKASSSRQLQWEEAVRAVVSLPAKVGNAVGRWTAEGWSGDIASGLMTKCVYLSVLPVAGECCTNAQTLLCPAHHRSRSSAVCRAEMRRFCGSPAAGL